jgi:hypothetical protein
LKRGEGLAQFQGYPFIMESCYHITPDEYERRRNLEWPAAVQSTNWKRNSAASRSTADESDQDDEAVPEITSGDQLEMRFTDLSDNETGSDTEGEGDRSEMIKSGSSSTSEVLSSDTGGAEPSFVIPEESAEQVDEIVWDQDRPISKNPNLRSGKTDSSTEVDPQALKDILKTLDEFNL